MEPEEFFELVQQIRRQVLATYEHEKLIEAIADELEREHDFITVSDDRLTAAVNVSRVEDDNFLADLEAEAEDGDEFDDADGDDDDGELRGDVRSVYVELEHNPDLRTH